MRAKYAAAVGVFVALPLVTATGALARSADDEPGEGPGTEGDGAVTGAVRKLPKIIVDKVKEAPPKGAGEQLGDYARTASRHCLPEELTMRRFVLTK